MLLRAQLRKELFIFKSKIYSTDIHILYTAYVYTLYITIYTTGEGLLLLETSSIYYYQTQDRKPTESIDLLNIVKSYLHFGLAAHNVST